VITGTWALCNYHLNKQKCWSQSFELSIAWIVMAPIIAALTVRTPGASKGTPGDAKCVTAILGGEGTKIRKLERGKV